MDYNSYRRKTNEVRVGSLRIGGRAPITLQSMLNTDTHDVESCYRQALMLEECGCDILRLTAPDVESVSTFTELKKRGITMPLVADIHFNYKIALAAVEAGVDKIRINPGNIGSLEKTRLVAEAAKERDIPIRIGVNSGSVDESLLKKYGGPCAEALAESAIMHASILEELDFHKVVLSVKASDVETMIKANRLLAQRTSYPLHLGVTEAGARLRAAIKSSVGIGSLLAEGIGDTVRVSLTEDPTAEIAVAKEILSSLGLSERQGMDIVSCPTCGRTKINLISLVEEFEAAAKAEGLDKKNIKVAIMGCVVNGPGEAKEADIGVAGGSGQAILFKKGEIVKKIKEEEIIGELIKEIKLI